MTLNIHKQKDKMQSFQNLTFSKRRSYSYSSSYWVYYYYTGALFLSSLLSQHFTTAADAVLSEQHHDIPSISSIDAFEIQRLENTDTGTDDDNSSSNDKYRTLKTSIAAFLITIGGLGILGWIYLAALRMKYNRELKREEKLKKRMELETSEGINPYNDNDEELQNHGCGRCCNGQPSHDTLSPFPIPMYPNDHDHAFSKSPNRNIHETSFDGQFGITSVSPRYTTTATTTTTTTPAIETTFIPEDDMDSFARALRNAAIQDDLEWNAMQVKKKRMMEQQRSKQEPLPQHGLRQQQPNAPTRQYDASSSMKYMPQTLQTWYEGEYGDPDDVWITSHSASTTGHSESETTTSMSSHVEKNRSVEEGQQNDDGFKVMKNEKIKDINPRHLLNPLRRGDESSSNDEDSFGQAMSIASGTSTSLGIPSVSASAIDRDPVMHGFFVIDEDNDLMDQYIPQDESEAAVHAAVATLKNSPGSSKGRMGNSGFDKEPLLQSSDTDTSQHLQPYKLRKSPHFVPSEEDDESPRRQRTRSPFKTTNSILNDSLESSTTGEGTGISTTGSYESDPRKSKAIFHELKNVSVFLKKYEKKKTLKKKKNTGKFKLMNQGRATTSIPELDEQLEDLSVDTSTYDGSNLVPFSLASLATTKSEGETSGDVSSKRMGLYSFGRKKKGYISEKEVKSMEVKIKPKRKKSRSAKRSSLPPRHGNTSPRPEAMNTTVDYPAIRTSPSGESAASERRFLTTEIESFFAQQGKGLYESIEVSPKSTRMNSPVALRDDSINKISSASSDLDFLDVMNDENRASLSVDSRLGAAPFNPKESSPNMNTKFVEKFSSPGWKKMSPDAATKSGSIEQKKLSPSSYLDSSPSNVRNASPSNARNASPSSFRISSPSSIRNSSPTYSSSSLQKDSSISPVQSSKKLPSPKMNNIYANINSASPNSNHRHPSPVHQSSSPFDEKVLEELPDPASIRENALRARKHRELMGFPKRNNMNSSPSPLPPPPPPQQSPLAQSAKKIIETGAKGFASIVERTRNQSPKNVVVDTGSSFPTSPNRLVPSSKDTAPIFVQKESSQNTSTANFESKIQSSARSLMSMFENKSVDGNKSTDGTSLSSENKISDRISNRLNQIRQSVKERTIGSGMNDVPPVVVETKQVETKEPSQDNSWMTNDKSKTVITSFPDTPPISNILKSNVTSSSTTTTNALPNKISSLHSALKSSNEDLSPKKRLRSPGKLLKQPTSSHSASKSSFQNQQSGQVSGDNPSREGISIERRTRKAEHSNGISSITSPYGFQRSHNDNGFGAKVRRSDVTNNDTKNDANDTKNDTSREKVGNGSSPRGGGNHTRNIISMFESKTTNHGIFPHSEHWQHTGTLRSKQQDRK
jgi:hypothetical protein